MMAPHAGLERRVLAALEAGVGSHHRLVSCMGIRTPC